MGRYDVNLSGLSVQRSLTDQSLQPGMMLTLKTDGQQTVTGIIYDDLLRAPVSEVNPAEKALIIAGMKVLTEGSRWGNGLTLENAKDKMVEVSGFMLGEGVIQATYLELDEEENGEIEGPVSKLSMDDKSFTLGTVTVDYSGISIVLNNEDWVEVEGKFSQDGKTIKATEIEVDNPEFSDGSMEMEGIVTWVSPQLDTLELNRKRVVTLTEQTRYEGIAGAAGIKPGFVVEIEGVWNSNKKTLIAREIERDQDDDLIPSIPSLDSREFELDGKAYKGTEPRAVIINDIPFHVAGNADVEVDLETLSGDWVSVSGYEHNDQYRVMDIEYEHSDGTIELEGKVINSQENNASLFGYYANDNSLDQYLDKHVELECQLQGGRSGMEVHSCKKDD